MALKDLIYLTLGMRVKKNTVTEKSAAGIMQKWHSIRGSKREHYKSWRRWQS